MKVWYHTSSWQSGVTSLNSPPEKAAQGEVNYSFVYLAHPRTVTGFSWRKTSKYMPRSVKQMLYGFMKPTVSFQNDLVPVQYDACLHVYRCSLDRVLIVGYCDTVGLL